MLNLVLCEVTARLEKVNITETNYNAHGMEKLKNENVCL
jgi:hypothetical protein